MLVITVINSRARTPFLSVFHHLLLHMKHIVDTQPIFVRLQKDEINKKLVYCCIGKNEKAKGRKRESREMGKLRDTFLCIR